MLETVKEMYETSPVPTPFNHEALTRAIEEALECSQTCTACADDCLGEENVQELTRCIALNIDCADICATTARVLSRQSAFEPAMARHLLRACADSCRVCGMECEQHAMHHEHCRVCAESCKRCEEACETALSAISS